MPVFRDRYGPAVNLRRIKKALAELVALKIIKDNQGRTPEYRRRQPAAWAEAIAALTCDGERSCPPCLECGALTPEEADRMCHVGGDRDECHGCRIW